MTICCVMAVGCAYNDKFEAPPSPLDKLAEAADVLQTVNERRLTGELFPDEVAALQARYEGGAAWRITQGVGMPAHCR